MTIRIQRKDDESMTGVLIRAYRKVHIGDTLAIMRGFVCEDAWRRVRKHDDCVWERRGDAFRFDDAKARIRG